MAKSLALMAALAMAESMIIRDDFHRDVDLQPSKPDTVELGRRAEKKAIALAKAQAKRERKNAKRRLT